MIYEEIVRAAGEFTAAVHQGHAERVVARLFGERLPIKGSDEDG